MKIFYKIFYRKDGNAQVSRVQNTLSPLSRYSALGFKKDEENCTLRIAEYKASVLQEEEQGVLL